LQNLIERGFGFVEDRCDGIADVCRPGVGPWAIDVFRFLGLILIHRTGSSPAHGIAQGDLRLKWWGRSGKHDLDVVESNNGTRTWTQAEFGLSGRVRNRQFDRVSGPARTITDDGGISLDDITRGSFQPEAADEVKARRGITEDLGIVFIEQIIATGETGGIALAEGLLASNPETIAEIQSLFKEIESVAGTGADALANQLFEKQGLATAELVTLFDDTNKQLLDALAANYDDYTKSLDEAGTALKDSLTDITADFNEAIAEMEGKLGGLGATIAAFRSKLTGLAEETISATTRNAIGAVGKTSGAFTPEAFDIDKALGLPPGGFAATQFPPIATKPTNLPATTQPATVINLNVRTDQTQSTAQVGQTIANAINKYTAIGGRLAV
jgi:hypothetical protein